MTRLELLRGEVHAAVPLELPVGECLRELAYFTGPLTPEEWKRAIRSVAPVELEPHIEAVLDVITRLHLGDVDMFARLAARTSK